MKTAVLSALLIMCVAQFQSVLIDGDQVETIDVDNDQYKWMQFEVGTVAELQFPVDHLDGGYSWYLDELYHDCDLDL